MLEELTFLHFNDVYHIHDVDLLGRFSHILHDLKSSKQAPGIKPVTVFSGDAFSPSLESSVLKGEHIVPFLNHLQIDVACYGNHDFDFGESRLIELSQLTNFPWVLSNAVHSAPTTHGHHHTEPGKLLASAHHYITKHMGQYKIGFLGLAGTDWPSNCQHLPHCDILSPDLVARQLAKHLRDVEKCDFVIAITHMRLAEDLLVSNATEQNEDKVDILLGGHDHDVVCRLRGETDEEASIILQGQNNNDVVRQGELQELAGNVRIVKSGTDWKGFSIVKLVVGRDAQGKAYLDTVKLKQYHDIRKLPCYASTPVSQEVRRIHSSVHARITDAVSHPLLYTSVPLEGRSTIIRSRETNLGNMLADAVRAFYSTDIAFVNSGGIRCDRIVEPGRVLTVKDIIDIVPFDNPFVVKRIRGPALLAALENSIGDSHTDGRFLHFSGLRLVGDWRKPEGQRVLEAWYIPRTGDQIEELVSKDKSYTVAMVSFIAQGFDGYTWFKSEQTLVGEEGAMTDTSLLLQIFQRTGLSGSEEHGEEEDETSRGIEHAREAIVVGRNQKDGLPIVGPSIQRRIRLAPQVSL